MRKLAAIFSPVLLAFFVACGGGGDSPPPLSSLPQVTPEIKCADFRLDDALNKCKSDVSSQLPLLLANQGGNGDDPGRGALLAALLANRNRNTPPPPPAPPGDPSCSRPQVDNKTSCNDDLITALLLWKSAPKKDNSLAIYDPLYRRYLFLKLRGFLNQSAQQMGLNRAQGLQLADRLKDSFTSNVLSRSGLSPSEVGGLSNYLNGGAPRIGFGDGRPPLVTPPPSNLLGNRYPGGLIGGRVGYTNPPGSGGRVTYQDDAPHRFFKSEPSKGSLDVVSRDQMKEAMKYALPSSSIFKKAPKGSERTGP